MENWQDEIIKAQISQEIGVERSMENSDISIFLKSFKENLIGAVDRDSFDKSWSSDLQSKFPNGSWRTVNGARVFINNGKVVAGLDGFNGEIDKFFEGRGKKGESKDKKEVKSNIPKEFAHELENYKKATGDKKAAMRKTLLGNANIKDEGLTETQKEIKQRSIYILKESGESHKVPQDESEDKKEGKLSEREQGLLDAYNKDKKAFIKRNTELAMFNPKVALESIDNWLSGETTKEYKDMLAETKKAIEDKLSEPKNTMNSFKEAEDKLKRFVGENEEEIDLDKFLQGDVVENFKEYKAYETAAKKAEKAGNAVVWREMIQMPPMNGKEIKLPKKDIKVSVVDNEKSLSGVVSTDDLRPVMMGIYHDPEGYMVATDAHRMVSIKTDVSGNSGKIIDPKTGREIDGKFPNWKSVMPNYDGQGGVSMKLSDLHSLSSQAKNIIKHSPLGLVEIDGIEPVFDPKILNDTVESLRKMGMEDVKLKFSGNDRAMLMEGKNSKGEDVQAVIMPKKMKYGNETFIIKQK